MHDFIFRLLPVDMTRLIVSTARCPDFPKMMDYNLEWLAVVVFDHSRRNETRTLQEPDVRAESTAWSTHVIPEESGGSDNCMTRPGEL